MKKRIYVCCMKNAIEIKIFKVPSDEEISIVQLIADDKRPEEIGGTIKKNTRMVYDKINTMKRKYDCKTQSGLVVLFFRNKLIS